MRSCLSVPEGGGVIAREFVASRVQAPPAFCTEAKVAKGGAYLRDTTVCAKSSLKKLGVNGKFWSILDAIMKGYLRFKSLDTLKLVHVL